MRLMVGILAAGRGGRLNAGVPKGWATLCDKPLVYQVIGEVEKLSPETIFVFCPNGWQEKLPSAENIRSFPGRGNYLGDLFGLIEVANEADLLVIVNADAVLVTVESLADLIRVTEDCEADFVWPGVSANDCSSGESVRFVPGEKRLRRSNVLAVRPKKIFWSYSLKLILFLMRCKAFAHIGEVFVALGVMGFIGVIKCLCQSMKPQELSRRIGRFLGCKAAIPEMHRPEFAFDVDYPQDLLKAEELLIKRRNNN